MDETRIFAPASSSLERTRQLDAWLRRAHARALDDREAELVRWLLDRHAAKLPLDLILGTTGLPVFIDPHRTAGLEPLVDDAQELAFVARFSSLGEERARKLQRSAYRYLAFMDIVEPDEFFADRATFEAERHALAELIGAAEDPPAYEFAGFAALAAHDWGLSAEEAGEYERLQTLFLAAMGLVEFEDDAAGNAPTLAGGEAQAPLAPELGGAGVTLGGRPGPIG